VVETVQTIATDHLDPSQQEFQKKDQDDRRRRKRRRYIETALKAYDDDKKIRMVE
jgi:hypothetical protein